MKTYDEIQNLIKKISIVTLSILLIGIFALSGWKRFMGDNYTQSELDVEIEKLLMETAKEINKQTPFMIDENTRADSIVAAKKQMMYKHTLLNISKSEIDKKEFRRKMIEIFTEAQCTNSKMLELLNYGVEYSYSYFDKNGLFIDYIILNKDNCKN